jgi:tripartite-type tricarboxylate transporter receptor subunit TctC
LTCQKGVAMIVFQRFARVAACALGVLFAGAAMAGAYPDKPIRLLVPYPPGGITDVLTRSLAELMRKELGQPVIVENKPGANTAVAAQALATAPADGYTVMMAFQSQAVAMTLYSKPGYDLVRDFAPVTLLATGSFLVAAHPAMPVKSVKELIAFAKARPGQVNVGLAGSGLILAAHLFYGMAGVKMTDVIYRSTPQSLTALLSGEVSAGFLPASPALPHIKSGKLRTLAVTAAQRRSIAPDLPTVAEAGLPGYEASSFYGLLVPIKTPPEIVARLHAESVKVLGQPELKAQFGTTDLEPAGSTPDQFGALIRSEIEKWGKIVKAAGLRPE